MKLLARTIAIAAAALTAAAAFAAPPTTTTSTHTTKTHHGIMSILHRPARPGASTTVGKPLFAGNIIGNKRTRVYHMPGDRGALPAAQNRVYFHTEGQARAAGFRRAGAGSATRRPAPHTTMHRTTMHVHH